MIVNVETKPEHNVLASLMIAAAQVEACTDIPELALLRSDVRKAIEGVKLFEKALKRRLA